MPDRRQLNLTSPWMRGPDVTAAQRRLKGDNVAKRDFLLGPVDGVFGPETARACIRAKYWLGYDQKNVKGYYGPMVDAYLSGEQPLPEDYKVRMKRRAAEAGKKPLREKALERAAKDLGMKEEPAGSNLCPISKRWGMQGPWCMMAVSIWYIDSGSKAFTERQNWAYVPYFVNAAADASFNSVSLVRWEQVLPGMAVCFDWGDDGVADHVGLVRKKLSGTTFETIEGNTSAGSNSNGGQVQIRQRSINDVARIARAPAFVSVGR